MCCPASCQLTTCSTGGAEVAIATGGSTSPSGTAGVVDFASGVGAGGKGEGEGEGTRVGVGAVRGVGVAVGVAVSGRRVAVAEGMVVGGWAMTMGVAVILPWHPLRTSKLSSAELSKRWQRVVANLKKLLMSSPSVRLRTGDASSRFDQRRKSGYDKATSGVVESRWAPRSSKPLGGAAKVALVGSTPIHPRFHPRSSGRPVSRSDPFPGPRFARGVGLSPSYHISVHRAILPARTRRRSSGRR